MTSSAALDPSLEPTFVLRLAMFGAGTMRLALRGDIPKTEHERFRALCRQAKVSLDRNGREGLIARIHVGDMLALFSAEGFAVSTEAKVQLALDFDRETARERARERAIADAAALSAVDRRLAACEGVFPFQAEGVRWLTLHSHGLLCDEMGLGKTLQVLLALDSGERGLAPPGVLVCCPANAKGTWERETRARRPEYRIAVLKGEGNFRWPTPGELVIINYDILPNPADIETSPQGKTVVVGDEAHFLKNAKSLRTTRFRAIRERVTNSGGLAWGVTGTPLPDRAFDLWAVTQAFGLAREAFGSYDDFVLLFSGKDIDCPKCRGGFVKTTCSKCHGSGNADGAPCAKCAGSGKGVCKPCRGRGKIIDQASLSPTPEVQVRFRKIALRRLRKDVLPELPPMRVQTHAVSLEETRLSEIDEALPEGWEDMLEEALESTESELSIGELSRARAMLAAAKTAAAVEMAKDFGDQEEPLIFFSCHSEPLRALARLEGWELIDGTTAAEERTRIENDFQAGKIRGIAANVKAGGTSLTLTRAAHVAFVDQSWTPAENAQARDRVNRIGQTRGTIVHLLVAEHQLDVRVAEILEQKMKLIAGALGG